MGQSRPKRSFSKQEIEQKWDELIEYARQFANCPDDQLPLREKQLRLCLKMYLKMKEPWVTTTLASDRDTVSLIYVYTCYELSDEPLSDFKKLRLQDTLEQALVEPRNWRYFKGWRRSLNKLKKIINL